jgi:phage-related protein (TIGR01555 family)
MSRLGARAMDRADGWESNLMGIGTSDDKLASLRYAGYTTRLTDPVLEAMFMSEIYAYRGVVIYPKVAFSRGVEVGGVAKPAEATTYLRDTWRLAEVCTAGAIWGRLYGGAVTWFVTDRDAHALSEPLEDFETVIALRSIERPYINALADVSTFDVHGRPQYYTVTLPEGVTFTVHVSRLVIWPGDDTPERHRVRYGHWDASVLQRPYDVLRRNGYVSIASQQLISEASLGVLKVKELWAAISGGQQTALATRIRLFNASRSQARAMILDADKEDFSRVSTTFAGVADLTDRARLEVAAAFGIPVTRLLGQSPAGLNATGASDERNFQSDVGSYQAFVLAERVSRIAKVLLDSPGSPCASEGLAVSWPELWAPTAVEAAQIYSTISSADANMIDREVLTVEQARSRYRPEGYSAELDVNATEDTDDDGDLDLNDEAGDDEDAPPKPGEAAKVEGEEGAPAAGGTTSAPQGDGGIQSQVFNGTQVSSLIETITAVHAGEIPRESGVEIIMLAYQVERSRAEALLGPEDFEPTKPEPPAFGGGGKPPFGKPAAPGEKPPAAGDDVSKDPPKPL